MHWVFFGFVVALSVLCVMEFAGAKYRSAERS